jgi:pectate lyase
MLLGHDDDNATQDVGNLKVTYHHWLDETRSAIRGCASTNRCTSTTTTTFHNTDVGVACQADTGCMVEGDYFENVEEPVSNSYAGPEGRCVARNNVFTGTEPGQPDCRGSVQEPRNYYSSTLDDPERREVRRHERRRRRGSACRTLR